MYIQIRQDGCIIGYHPYRQEGWIETELTPPEDIFADYGIPIYRLETSGGEPVIVPRAQEEIDAEYPEPSVEPTESERIAKLEEQNDMLTQCILEMSTLLYE